MYSFKPYKIYRLQDPRADDIQYKYIKLKLVKNDKDVNRGCGKLTCMAYFEQKMDARHHHHGIGGGEEEEEDSDIANSGSKS